MDKHKFEQEELDLVERTATSAGEIWRFNNKKFKRKDIPEQVFKDIRDKFIDGEEKMKKAELPIAKITLLRQLLTNLMSTAEQWKIKFDTECRESSTIPYTYEVTEKELRTFKAMIQYKYLSVEHQLDDILDEVLQLGEEVDYGERK